MSADSDIEPKTPAGNQSPDQILPRQGWTKMVKLCRRGHMGWRNANGTCVECERARDANRRVTPGRKATNRAYEEKRKRPDSRARRRASYAERLSQPDVRKRKLVKDAKHRAQAAGVEATITVDNIYWPKVCPVLGIALDYGIQTAPRVAFKSCSPSLDRWDNAKGYTPENVFVISLRANILKRDANWRELMAVAEYARDGISMAGNGLEGRNVAGCGKRAARKICEAV